MDAGQPSRTALATAAARAAHLIIDRAPWIFEDTLALALLGDLAADLIAVHRERATAAVLAALRVAMTTRSRYTEDRLRAAVAHGLRQYVLLGAGLDSFAYRSPWAAPLCVFEVDHPATQAWKRDRLAAAAIPVPPHVRFVPVDLAVDSLGERLGAMGCERSQPAFVSWLGVTQYLSAPAISATLEVIGGFAVGTELVMEYLVPAELRDAAGQALADYFMPRAAAVGEPWVTFLSPSATARLLSARGLVLLDDVGRKDQIEPGLWTRADALSPHELGRLARAGRRAVGSHYGAVKVLGP
jgi:methyltransferase (TIGR00027 family)